MLGSLILLTALAWLTVFFVYIIKTDKPLLEQSLSHWYHSAEGLTGSTAQFYSRVQELVTERRMPGVVMKVISWHEAGFLSDKRDYLRVRRHEYTFDLCVAPFGNTLFVSTWLAAEPQSFMEWIAPVPFFGVVGRLYIRLFRPYTYYSIDAGLMFQGAVQGAVLKVLDEMSLLQGVEPIPESLRKPAFTELYGRKAAR
ncbi:MAG TPA: hypothetical protein VFS20_23885 [Longimicrobium sp.]|nr:hypothetical protein [Longimicrobium sp.]